MRDAFNIKGEQVKFMDKVWTIGEVMFVPNNPNLYVELKSNGVTMNTQLKDITNLIISYERVKQVRSNIL
jgi:hypothetical protein